MHDFVCVARLLANRTHLAESVGFPRWFRSTVIEEVPPIRRRILRVREDEDVSSAACLPS